MYFLPEKLFLGPCFSFMPLSSPQCPPDCMRGTGTAGGWREGTAVPVPGATTLSDAGWSCAWSRSRGKEGTNLSARPTPHHAPPMAPSPPQELAFNYSPFHPSIGLFFPWLSTGRKFICTLKKTFPLPKPSKPSNQRPPPVRFFPSFFFVIHFLLTFVDFAIRT